MPFYPYFLQPHIANVYGSRIYNSWETPSVSYEDFVTGVTKSYQDGGNFNKFYSDYVTRYFEEGLTGGTSGGGTYVTGGTANGSNSTLVFTNSSGTSFTVTNSALLFNDAYVSGGTLNTTTGIVTFRNSSGGTFTVSGFTGFTSYWSANTNESISPSGDSTNVHFPAIVGISGDTYIGGEIYADMIKRESSNSTTTKLKSSANKWEIYAGHSSNEVMKIESGIVTVAGDITVDDFASLDSARIGGTATDPGTGHLYVEENLTVDVETLYADKSAVTGVGGVGVGTLAPTHKLTVSGDPSITGWTEWVSTDFTNITLNNGSEVLVYNPTDLSPPSGAFGAGTSIRLYVEGIYYYTAVGAGGVASGRFYMSDAWEQDTYETDSAAVASTIISYPSNINKSFAVYSGSDIAFQVSDKKVMSGSTDLLDIFASSAITNQDIYWSASTGGISNSGLTGNVGIGVTIPNEKLTVAGDISGSTDLHIGGNMYSGSTNLLSIFAGSGITNQSLYWSANTDSSISPSGITTNVGIGTTTPTGLFEVKDLIKFPETNSTFIGADAGANWEAGSTSGTALGRLAMGLGTLNSAKQNTALGFASLGYLTTGDYNTAVGLQSNTSIDTGSWNTSIGTTSMFGATYHSYNTALGANTMYFTTSGSLGKTVPTDTHNTAIGYSSQYYNLNGAYNTSVGSQSMGNSTIAYAGTGNTAMGFKSLFNSTTGNYNVTLGYQAGDNITSGDYNISIGPNSDPPSATADYQMNIGGIIHGQDAYSDSAISQVGIGTTTPKVKLDVHHDPTNLAANTGGGEVVTFGTEDGTDTLAAGRLMYLHTDGKWLYANAGAVADGGSQLLGIALGTTVAEGILLRGYFDQVSYLDGSFVKGAPCYMHTDDGEISFTAPTGTNKVVRVVGYGTDLANAIYFNPDQTWVELS